MKNIVEVEGPYDNDPQLFRFEGDPTLSKDIVRKALFASGYDVEGVEKIIEDGDLEDDSHFIYNDGDGYIKVMLHRESHIQTLK